MLRYRKYNNTSVFNLFIRSREIYVFLLKGDNSVKEIFKRDTKEAYPREYLSFMVKALNQSWTKRPINQSTNKDLYATK